MSQVLLTDTECGPTCLHSTIVVDPPWQYDNRATRGAAEDHYQTMTLAELAALPIPAAADAHLYLWVTNGFLRQGFDLLDAWGFTYKTCVTWVKPQLGIGNWFRGSTEHVLVAMRGHLAPTNRNQPTWFDGDVAFTANRTRHSQKPDAFYDLVEMVSPGPWLEMFARRRRMGWHWWGDQA
jgi:N6-adenosine-specific RNA methylase IME4